MSEKEEILDLIAEMRDSHYDVDCQNEVQERHHESAAGALHMAYVRISDDEHLE